MSPLIASSQIVSPSKPTVTITEQPVPNFRFRYKREGRTAGSIPGVFTTPEHKSYPTIKIEGYHGRAKIVVSCVTNEEVPRPHPHSIVGKEGCKNGVYVCNVEVSRETMFFRFLNLGIQCAKKIDVEEALLLDRQKSQADPFKTGFKHDNISQIDLNVVRLCFEVFLENEQRDKCNVPLTPVVTQPITNNRSVHELSIIKLSDSVSPVDGGKKDIILLCDKVLSSDIQVRFYEEENGKLIWEGFGDFQQSQVHRQVAIWFRPPPYKTTDVTEPVKVLVQLLRPSDGATSKSLPFELLPLNTNILKRKQKKFENFSAQFSLQQIQQQQKNVLCEQFPFGTPNILHHSPTMDHTTSPSDLPYNNLLFPNTELITKTDATYYNQFPYGLSGSSQQYLVLNTNSPHPPANLQYNNVFFNIAPTNTGTNVTPSVTSESVYSNGNIMDTPNPVPVTNPVNAMFAATSLSDSNPILPDLKLSNRTDTPRRSSVNNAIFATTSLSDSNHILPNLELINGTDTPRRSSVNNAIFATTSLSDSNHILPNLELINGTNTPGPSSVNNIHTQSWNILDAGVPELENNLNSLGSNRMNNLNNFLTYDNQLELKPIEIKSGELGTWSLSDVSMENLSENLSNNLSFTEVGVMKYG